MNAVLDIGVTPARVAAPTLVAMERAVVAFATEMQRTLVPPLCYRGDCVEAHGQCIPKDEVGGDLMEMIKTAMRYGLLLQRPLGNLISDLNRLLPQVKEPSMFATLAALRFDGSNEVEYVSAGHVPLLHFRKRTNDVITHHAQQFPLGLLPGHAVVTRRIPYEAGDVFVLPTDGALELGEEPDAEAGLAVLARTLSSFNAAAAGPTTLRATPCSKHVGNRCSPS